LNPEGIKVGPLRIAKLPCLPPLSNILTTLHIGYIVVDIIMLQSPPEANYPTLQTLLEAVQMHALSEAEKNTLLSDEGRRSKSDYKSDKIIKIVINCERDDHSRKKTSSKKKKRIDNIKINCSFRVNALYKESLDI
jgi:hypothetical protein